MEYIQTNINKANRSTRASAFQAALPHKFSLSVQIYQLTANEFTVIPALIPRKLDFVE